MKRLLSLFLLLAILLTFAVGCGTPGETTPAETTTEGKQEETPTPAPALPDGERLVKPGYTAVLNDEAWVGGGDTGNHEIQGTGVSIYQEINTTYKGYAITYVIVENGTETSYSGAKAFAALKSVGPCGADVTLDETAKTATVKVTPVVTKVVPSWKAVNAKEGSYLRFDFTASLSMEYAVTVTLKEGGSHGDSVYTADGITVKGENGKYTGVAKCTVPCHAGKTFYINICAAEGYAVLASVPVNITPGDYDTGYQLVFSGDWELVEDETYFDRFIDLFHHTYPKLYARFGMLHTEPKTITFVADKGYSGVAYQSGGKVVISVDYLNNDTERIGAFSHEITHSVQQFGGKLVYDSETVYIDPVTGERKTANGWFTENMANYGRFRYFEWDYSAQHVRILDPNKDSSLWDWGWGQYGNGGMTFIAWLDKNYPTTDKNGDGKVTLEEYGALDRVVYAIKHTKEKLSDNPYDPTSDFSKALATATGGKFKTMEEARLQYVADCKSGAFVFDGFADYKDNFLTEGLKGVPESYYITKAKVEPTGKTNPLLSAAVTTGDNLCIGARIRTYASRGMGTHAAENLIDGDTATRYQTGRASTYFGATGISNEVVIDLGRVRAFDTYTLVCYANQTNFIAKSFEILVSSDGGNYTAVDYRKDNTAATVSVTFDEVFARYVMIRLYQPDGGSGNTRISEFMLFDSKK